MDKVENTISASPDETFHHGERLGARLDGGEVVLLIGGLGAGKTLFTKGILSSLDFDVDEVTSPSFALVNLYKAPRFDVYHLDLWRIEKTNDVAFSVGLTEILEDESAVVIIEWAEKIGVFQFDSVVYRVNIAGDGDDSRSIDITKSEQTSSVLV